VHQLVIKIFDIKQYGDFMKCVDNSDWSTGTVHAGFFIEVQHKYNLKFCVKHCLWVKKTNHINIVEVFELMFEVSVLFEFL